MLKIGFVTCVQLGLSCMEAIYEAGGKLTLVITLEDDQAVKKSGRVYLDAFCEKRGVKIHKSRHVNNLDVVEAIRENQLDWLFIIGWSQIASNEVLEAPKLGVLGMHPTLLPMGRGRASIPWAIIKGLEKTGVTLFKLDNGVDTGDIIKQHEIPLRDDMDAAELYQLVNKAHVQLMYDVVPKIYDDSIRFIKQDDTKATVWPGRKPEDGKIDVLGSVHDAACLIRAVTKPYPGAFIQLDKTSKMIIWRAKITNKVTDRYCIEFKDGILECQEYEYVH